MGNHQFAVLDGNESQTMGTQFCIRHQIDDFQNSEVYGELLSSCPANLFIT